MTLFSLGTVVYADEYADCTPRELTRLLISDLAKQVHNISLFEAKKHAKQLITQTDKSILEIGHACGFTSAPHFSTTYKGYFGVSPREERKILSIKHNNPVHADKKTRQLWRKKF